MDDLLNYESWGNLEGPEYTFGIGPLLLFVHRQGAEWKVAFKRDATQVHRWFREDRLTEEAEAEGLKWVTFASRSADECLSIVPAFPTLPVVIRPYAPYVLRPSDKVSFFMSIPLSVRICSALDSLQVLIEEPVSLMSKSWFGDPESGELCQASRTYAVRELDQLDTMRHRIISPVRMRNLSDEVLPFNRFCLRTRYLDLYAGPKRFWSNEVGISYKGVNEASRVAPSPSAPGFEKPLQKIHAAERKDRSLFQLQTFISEVVGL